jgi:BON domain-containing protein
MKTDSDLQREVADELVRQMGQGIEQLNVAVHDGMVTLTGRVCSLTQKWLAEYTAMYVYGVQAIANNIDVWLSVARPSGDPNRTGPQRAGGAALREREVSAGHS